MSVGISQKVGATVVQKILEDSPLEQSLLALRREQLKLQAQATENERRVNALHDALSSSAKNYNLQAGDFSGSVRNELPNIKSVPMTDSLGKKIKSSVVNLAERLFSFFKSSNKLSDEDVFEPYLQAIDRGLKDADHNKDFATYFYANDIYEMTVVEPGKEETKILLDVVINDVLVKSPKLDFSKPASENFMQRFAVLTSDFLYKPQKFKFDEKNEKFQQLYQLTARYLDLALENKNFTSEISKSKASFKEAVPGIVRATLMHAKAKSKNPEELKAKLSEYTRKIDDYFKGIINTVYNQDDPDEKISALFDSENDPGDMDLVALNQVNNFLDEAQKIPSAEQDLRAFLKHRPDVVKKVIDDLVPLAFEMIKHFNGESIHGSMNTFEMKSVDASTKESFSFEEKFADIAEIVYSLITFKAIPKAQSKSLIDWALSEEKAVKDEKMSLFIDTARFTKNPKNSKLRRQFFDNKEKIIYMYLMQSLHFDSKGKVSNLVAKWLTDLMNAVRKAQSVKKIIPDG